MSDSETDVRYYYIDRESEFYKDNVSLFQEKYNKYFKVSSKNLIYLAILNLMIKEEFYLNGDDINLYGHSEPSDKANALL